MLTSVAPVPLAPLRKPSSKGKEEEAFSTVRQRVGRAARNQNQGITLPALLRGASGARLARLFTCFAERFNRRDLLLKRPDLASHSINDARGHALPSKHGGIGLEQSIGRVIEAELTTCD